MAERQEKKNIRSVSRSDAPLTVSHDAAVTPDLPKLHVFTVKNEDEEVLGWGWRFELHGQTIAQSDDSEPPYPSRHDAIIHADAWGDREFKNWAGGARVSVGADDE